MTTVPTACQPEWDPEVARFVSMMKILEPYSDDERRLLCPMCGDGFTHHDRVDVFERTEDADEGLHVVVDGCDRRDVPERGHANVSISSCLDGNPSCRRQGISVGLYCESCGGKFVLEIAQHKGETLISTRPRVAYFKTDLTRDEVERRILKLLRVQP